MERMHALLLFCVWVVTVTRSSAWRDSPLPTFTRVRVQTTIESTLISVSFSAPDLPTAQWFIDGWPVPLYHKDFYTITTVYPELTLLSTGVTGAACSVCLAMAVGHTCLHIPVQPPGVDREQDLHFPWPLVVPASRARYEEGSETKVFVSSLTTNHRYNYTATLIATSPHHPHSPLLRAQSRDTQGDLVTMAPVTSGSEGWMVRVATDREGVEGVLLVKTAFTPTSDLVSSCTTIRPINIYQRHHSAPFPPGFLAQLPRDSPTLPWACRDGFSCLVTCPFVSNGDVTVSLSRVVGEDENEALPLESVVGEVVRVGDYVGEARFVVHDFNRTQASPTFRCHIATSSKAISFDVRA